MAPGDLLVVRTNGSRSLIGRSALVRNEFPEDVYFASYLIRYRFVSLEIATWTADIWNVESIRQYIEDRAATSAGQYNISLGVLDGVPVPLPPLNEQQMILNEIDRRFSIGDFAEDKLAINTARSERLRQSILRRAFSGLLTESSTNHISD